MRGLIKINLQKKDTKNLIQLIAKTLWSNDKSKSIRLGEMCEIVWGTYFTQIDSNKTISNEDKKYFKKEVPDMPSSLKSWLRKVAPEYAKKGGRPKGK